MYEYKTIKEWQLYPDLCSINRKFPQEIINQGTRVLVPSAPMRHDTFYIWQWPYFIV